MNQQLRVNPTACTGHGLCAELLPERVTLDEWGYPVISADPVPAQLARAARRAVPAASRWPCCSVTASGPGKQPGDGSGHQAPWPHAGLTRRVLGPAAAMGP